MHCKFCGFANGEDDHRCLRCGRRVQGVVIAAPVTFSSGANALAVAPALERERSPEPASPQPMLFPAGSPKVIPFNDLHRQVTGRLAVPAQEQKPAQRKNTETRQTQSAPAQTSMDFVPAAASAPRTLKTAVPAQIYCDHPVATPIHRFVAGAMDAAMILLGFGLFMILTQVIGGGFGEGKLFWGMIAGSFVLLAFFYGSVWALCSRETAGMSWTELELVTFDGFTVDRRTRLVRSAASWLSFCAGGIGVLWAAADEEKLAWHDHISKSFPTIREAQISFQRPRT